MMFDFFFALLLIVFIIFSYKKIIWGLAAIVALLPSYLWRFDIFGLPSTFLELMILFLFVIWFFKNKNIKNVLSDNLRWFFIFWLTASILALFINFNYSSLGLWRAYFFYALLFSFFFFFLV